MNSVWEPILQVALRTPSPHNTQPWRVRIISDRRATLFMDVARTLPDEDTTGHFLLCAMGMFLESLRIVSANAGHTLQHTLIDQRGPGPLIRFAELALDGPSNASAWPDHLFQIRKTSRLPSNGARIPPTLTAWLKGLPPRYGQHYHQFDDPTLIERVIVENIRAVFNDLNVSAYHREIARWFRYNDREAQTRADGLDYKCMRIRPMQLRLMQRLPQIMRWPLTQGIVQRIYRAQLGEVSHLGVISGPFFNDVAAINAGAFLMSFWLELSRQKLFIHPFGNLVTNPEARARVRELTGIDDVWLVFRVGYTDEPPESFRLPLNTILIHD